MEPLLQAVNLTKRFGGLTAVDNVSMDIFPGEVVGLVGDNGAGKSTLIKMISGVYQPDEGEIVFEGKKVTFAGPREARDLGIETIYQDLALAENLDVRPISSWAARSRRAYLGGVIQTLDRNKMRDEVGQSARPPGYSHPFAEPTDSQPVRWAAPGGGHRPHDLLERQDGHHGRADRRAGRERAAQSADAWCARWPSRVCR